MEIIFTYLSKLRAIFLMTVSLIARQLHQTRQGCLYCVILHCTGWAVLCTVSESLGRVLTQHTLR